MALDKGSPCPSTGVLARYVVTKINTWRGRYHRLFALLEGAIINIDPANWTITNVWRYGSEVVDYSPSVSSESEFTLTVKDARRQEVLKFGCDRRADLLADIARFAFGRDKSLSKSFLGLKITRTGARVETSLQVRPYAVAQVGPDGEDLSMWTFKEITSVKPLSDDRSAVVIEAHGRGHMFALRDVAGFLAAMSAMATKLGRTGLVSATGTTVTDFRTARVRHGNDGSPTVGEFTVTKLTGRHPTPRSRRLVLTETRITERDSSSYQVVSSRPYAAVLAVVRHHDEPQHVTVQYRDGAHRTYICPSRDALVAALLDGLRVVGGQALALPLASPINLGDSMNQPPLRIPPRAATPKHTGAAAAPGSAAAAAAAAGSGLHNAATAAPHSAGPGLLDVAVERFLLQHLDTAGKTVGVGAHAGAYNVPLSRAAAEFNATVEPLGVASDTGRGKLTHAVTALLAHCARAARAPDTCPSTVPVAYLHALFRVAGAHAACRLLGSSAEVVPLLLDCFRHPDPCVVTAALSLLQRLCRNPLPPSRPDPEGEVNARRVLLREDMREALADMLDHYTSGAAAAQGSQGTLVLLELSRLLDAVLVSAADTTPPEVGEHLMQLVASRYMAVLALFRQKVPSIIECAAMLMRGIIHQADVETCRQMQRAALSTGILLRHVFNSIFAGSTDQRFISRYLVEVWCSGNPTARTLFRHALPPGLLVYLETPKLSPTELLAMESLEAHLADGPAPGGAAAASSASASASASGAGAGAGGSAVEAASGLASRLRSRLEAADHSALNQVKRRLVKLAAEKEGGRRRIPFFGRKSRDQKRREAEEAEKAARAALAAEAEIVSGKMQEGAPDNFPIFFHMIMQDHDLPDLIWNAQTRGELRSALEAEMREIEREIELGGVVEEGAEGDISNRRKDAAPDSRDRATTGDVDLLGASAAATASPAADGAVAAAGAAAGAADGAEGAEVEDPKSASRRKMQFAWNYSEFEVTYPSLREELRVGDQYLRVFLKGGRRAVADLRECDRFFDALYRRVLRETAPSLRGMCLRGMELVYEQHWRTIGPFEDTDYIMWLVSEEKHNGVRDRLLMLARALALHPINCEKMINGDCIELVVDLLTTAHTMDADRRVTPQLKVGAGLMLRDATADEAAALHPEAGGSPSSAAGAAAAGAGGIPRKTTAKVWHYRADPRDVPEGEKPERGPYSLQDMKALGQTGQLKRSTLVWAAGMREWVRMDSMRALMWLVLSPGEPVLTPTERGLLCAKLLLRLVRLRPSVDGEGVPVRPVPMAKRVLSGARCMPHIAQAILTGDPDIVDTCTELICDVVAFNPAATIKLYTTGIFFFALGYGGSNFEKIALLLYITHLRQSFFSEAASLGRETTLARRSILGSLLPESMICVLENRGPKAFAEAFMSNVDTPEVIWKYEMRAHLLDMIGQHIGELPARLHANPATVYDYCPVPRVTFEELEKELWCANFYMANLTDEVRFPDWPIPEPVTLLRSLLDTWREEMSKEGEEVVSLDAAYTQLGVTPEADDKTIRKAYRKLAMKFHPDKNPAGRDTFEKIQAAYEALTAPRAEAAAGGPDPLVLLLVVRCQCILFKRAKSTLKEYKYAGYPAIMQGLAEIPATDAISSGDTGRMLEALTRLVYLTCLTSPRNGDELVHEGGVEALLGLLGRCVTELDARAEAAPADAPAPEDGPRLGLRVLENVLHTLSGLAAMPASREHFTADLAWAPALVSCLRFVRAPAIMKYALDAVARLAGVAEVQNALVDAGAIWRLLPLLFRFDVTLEREASDTAAADNAQKAANLHAKMAVRALSRLGGYLPDKQASPRNDRVRAVMDAMLTQVLARRLGRANPDSLLTSLVGHEESPTVMWNSDMRKELAGFVKDRLGELDATGFANMEEGSRFRFSTVAEELCVEGLYVRHFVADPKMALEAPFQLTISLLRHVAYSHATPRVRLSGLDAKGAPIADTSSVSSDDADAMRAAEGVSPDLAMRHVRLSLRALHLLIVGVSGADDAIATTGMPYIPSLFAALDADDGGITDEDVKNRAAASSARGAAGTGRSAGAGGARSSAAGPDAPLRELVMTVVAAASTSEAFCRSSAELHQLPRLVRELPNDPVGVGLVLRTMLTHTCAVTELRRVGGLIDLVTLFAGGTATGPAPGQPGGPSVLDAPRLSVPSHAREAAGALISAMCSDATEGPPNLMNLTQLVPEAMARAIKESVSGATVAGGPSVGSAGAGVGAQGAGGGGGLAQAVRFFDSDHETPELIWDVVCRHELRVTLGQLGAGLAKLRASAGRAGKAGGHDGCPWTMPAAFGIKYSPIAGELCVGGVYVRLFIKEPTFPLRDPKGFLESCLRRLQQECETLIGMTSDDAEAVARAVRAAEEEAKQEAANGGLKSGGAGGQAMVLRGEDVMTQVTHAIVCQLRSRPSFAEHLASLGFIPKLVKFVRQASGNKARYNIGVQCVRVIEVVSGSNTCVLQLSKQRIIETLLASITPPHRDTAFTLEAIQKMIAADSAGATPDHALVIAALGAGVVSFLVGILEKEDLSHLQDQSAAKVHAVTILKALEADTIHGPQASAKLAEHGAEWSRYKHQKHDMFLSRTGRADYFLQDVDTGPSRLLKNSAEYNPTAAAAAASSSSSSSSSAAPSGPLMLTDDSVPPPAPSRDPSYRGAGMGGFQAPAPAELDPPSGFGGFQAPAPAPVAYARPPAPAPAPAPSVDPFADMLAGAPAHAPAARAAAPAPASADPFADMMGSAPAPAPAPAPVSRPAPAAAAAAGDDPFADLLGSTAAPAPAAASGAGGDLFAGMGTAAQPTPAPRTAPRTAPAPAPAAADDDPFAGLLD